MEVHLSDVQRHLKTGQKSDLLMPHYGKHFKYNMSFNELSMYTVFKLVKNTSNVA